MVKSIRLKPGTYNRGIPVKPVFHILRLQGLVLYRRHHDRFTLTGSADRNVDRSLVASAHDHLRVIWIESNEGTFSTCRVEPVLFPNRIAIGVTACDHYRTVILLAGIDVIRK